MAIVDLQRRLTEAGRIRIGQQVATSGGKKRPEKLSTFRLTSSDRTRIQQAAALYGGIPTEWDAPAGRQWEIVTQTDSLNVLVPPSDMAFSQFYELWSGGGCQRRCDGRNETISDGDCLCDPDKRECNIHTRLSVLLRDLPGLGVWRIDTSGYYAALELQGAVEVIQLAAGRGQMLPARLRLEQRMTKRPGTGTRRFAVPVLDIEISPAQLLGGGPLPVSDTPPAIEQQPAIDGRASLTPVPEAVPERPTASIHEQATTEPPRRKRTAQPIARTGLPPRTVEQAATPPPPEPEPEPDKVTVGQNRAMHATFNDLHIKAREDRLIITSHIIGRHIDSSSQMTATDASHLIDTLKAWQDIGTADHQVREILNAAALTEENLAPDIDPNQLTIGE